MLIDRRGVTALVTGGGSSRPTPSDEETPERRTQRSERDSVFQVGVTDI